MSQLKLPVSLTWDLDSVFPGGSSSLELKSFIDTLEQDIKELEDQVKTLAAPTSVEGTKSLDLFIQNLQSVYTRAFEGGSFIGCLASQDQDDKKAIQLSGKVTSLDARLQSLVTVFDSVLSATEDSVFNAWIQREDVAPIAFVLTESREKTREKLPPEQESLVLELAVDGYHGWSEHYDTIVSKVKIPFTNEDGEEVILSAGQASNKLDDPKREVREAMFVKWEQAWTDAADYSADTLNRLAGFRLGLYNKRGWEDVLKEPLSINRMSKETLDAMWNAIIESKPIFVKYLERKAKLLGVERLSWTDVEAPVSESNKKISYDDAAKDIVKQFNGFSPKLANFAVDAFNKRWVEAEDRPGKRPGGFCTGLPESKETRIFMTYSGTASNVSTLAHELGHAYHQHVMDELPVFNQNYAMNVAETASTFAEMILSDAQVNHAANDQEKLSLLEDKIQRSVTFFMNIHARFLFETRFYDKRREGLLSAEELSSLMEEAQKEAFCNALDSYHPHFWASKLHFYITGVPFYNFPYTFGYLFSTGIFARAQREGQAFADKYDALLLDTGRMTVEDLAQKHLNVDLTQPDFWREAISLCIADVEQFLDMTK
ncbi:pepF/M3 family oligoendopeptidase [Paenibacillus shirakamiensis]|uniref:PepF/M3 family oligoendopeptidase n=1 Tax=Paenibacillus shirakamiensis TaxID=1265935 RepID=A0ABS4JM42_9BACL|nr:M3 family oligoendopeptidase [Paenibacillus shirakamiensis]MBP2002046.1 pepF/M3 family oligoendopeptidase [Paenibacillus shirakamiensis]